MATYNGATHLQEQLNSFVLQTRHPDELVVYDDCSTDSTVEILREFRAHAPFTVRLFTNTSNIGYTRNFERAIIECRGDVVLLSDQDDVWYSNKVATVARIFRANSQVYVLINDASIADSGLTSTGVTKLSQKSVLGIDNRSFVAGCCTSIRSNIIRAICPIPATAFSYDSWVHALAEHLQVRHILPLTLQYYRRHAHNTSNGLVSSAVGHADRVQFLRTRAAADSRLACRRRQTQLAVLEERIHASGPDVLEPLGLRAGISAALRIIRFERFALDARLSLLNLHRAFRVVPGLRMFAAGEYGMFSGWRSLMKDLISR